ncbi:hypothetical protein BH09GEM1_BH09GEM1_46100 [soil metagenome]
MLEDLTPAPPEFDAAELDEWKNERRAEFERWLESLDAIPDTGDSDADEPDAPDLYSFYEQLAAATTESRKSNRRTAEAFSQWSETLAGFDAELRIVREQLARRPVTDDDALPRSWCLALIEITDRMHRLAVAFAAPPRRSWWARGDHLQIAWETQRQGLDILLSHVGALVTRAEVTRIPVLHLPFDPATMSAVVAEPDADWPHNTVIEEIAPGYHLRGELLRVAQVKVSTLPRP